jgi:hypothetical protein
VAAVSVASPLPADASSPAGDSTGAPQQTCAECGRLFTPNPRGGTKQRYCGSSCRHSACLRRKERKEAANGLEPIPEWERPMLAPMDGTARNTAEYEAALALPAMPWERP